MTVCPKGQGRIEIEVRASKNGSASAMILRTMGIYEMPKMTTMKRAVASGR